MQSSNLFQGSKGIEGAGAGAGGGRALRLFMGSKNIEPLARGAAKISSFEFQYLHPLSPPPPPPPAPCHIKRTFPNDMEKKSAIQEEGMSQPTSSIQA